MVIALKGIGVTCDGEARSSTLSKTIGLKGWVDSASVGKKFFASAPSGRAMTNGASGLNPLFSLMASIRLIYKIMTSAAICGTSILSFRPVADDGSAWVQ